MPRSPRDGPASGAWQWSRTAQTQRALLDAARQVFTERGFAEASIADIVQRCGSTARRRSRGRPSAIWAWTSS